MRNGYGEVSYMNGSKYMGYWLNNMKHGSGILVYKDGSRYKGEFVRDKK
jgi:hypothetical protein